jgi:uncharacterized protein YjbI with pentapeptide repeats
MSEQQPEDDTTSEQTSEAQQPIDHELAFPRLKPGDVWSGAWGESITKQRAAELEAILHAWETEREHGERTGPFDAVRLTGADVFWLAARASAGTNETRIVAAFAEQVRYGDVEDMAKLHLEGANLDGANLNAAFLPGAHLEGVSIEPGELQGAFLVEAHLEGAQLNGVHLQGANLIKAHLQGAFLDGASMEGAQLHEAHLEGARVEKAHLEEANLSEAHLERASLIGTHLEGASLVDAHLEGAYLMGAHLEHARLRETHLEYANLIAARLEHAFAFGAHLEHTLLGGAHLEDVHLHAAHLERADLRSAFLDKGTELRDAVLGDEKSGYATLMDVRWGDVNLAVINWTRTTRGFLGIRKRIDAIELGDEREARSPTLLNEGLQRMLKDGHAWLQGYKDAVRANRQLATVLRQQGLNEDADRFAYKAQTLQREVLRRQGSFGGYAFSLLLWALSGYGYRLWRIAAAYGLVLFTFAVIFLALGVHSRSGEPGIQALWDSFLVSLSAIHGRTMFEQLGAWSPAAWVAAVESVVGIVIEGVFVAMLIQRFFAR